VNYKKKSHFILIVISLTFFVTAFADDSDRQQILPSKQFQEVKLGEALSYDLHTSKIKAAPLPSFEAPFVAQSVPVNNLGGWTIDTSDRQLVRQFYNSVYLGSLNTPIGWTGDQATCTAGTTTNEFKNSVLARINYFRAMAGVPATITFNSIFNTKAQKAALMMSANSSLNHRPPNTWNCYTSDGREAAGKSNLALGSNGWNSISGYMHDWGASNNVVGHRRWILYPQTLEMGTGDIDSKNSAPKANALWVQDGRISNPRPVTRDLFVAWPTTGYNPYQTVPVRWSFSYSNADFTSATITMTENGSDISTVIESTRTGFGENTIVWLPDGMSANTKVAWPKPVADKVYNVTIANVLIDGVSKSFNYSVTIFDPATALEEEVATITGNAAPAVGNEAYQFNAVNHATSYDILRGEVVASSDVYNAEDNGASVIDNTDSSHGLIQSGVGVGGSSAYSLKFNGFNSNESFEILNSLIPSASSQLLFDSKLGYSGTGQIASVQVSTDDGASWKAIFSQAGTGGLVNNNYVSRSFSLADYADKMIRIRVDYRVDNGMAFTSGPNSSFLVDNLRVSHAKKVINFNVDNNGSSTTFSSTIEQNKEHIFSVRPIFWAGYAPSDWGPVFSVIANIDLDNDGVENSVDNCPTTNNPLQENSDGDSEGNACDDDDDNDGMPDVWENQYGLDPLNASDAESDSDNDGVTNLSEYVQGTDPLVKNDTAINIIPILMPLFLDD